MRFILTLLIALFCAPHTAAAAAPREFYGVVSAKDPDQTELARMRAGGVGTLRINFVWGVVESGPGAQFDWSHYDTLIGEAAAQGIRVLPTVYSSPLWAAARDNYPPSPGSLGDYAAFVEAAAARYGSNGTFWARIRISRGFPFAGGSSGTSPTCRCSGCPSSAPELCRPPASFQPRHSTGRPECPRAAGRPLPGPVHPRRRRHTARALPPGDLPSGKAKKLFDGVDLHPYANTPNLVMRDVKLCRQIMTRFKDQKTPIWLGEVGWTTGGDPSRLTVSPRRQAAYLKRTYRAPRDQPEARQDRRRDLVLVEGPAGFRLVQPHWAVHH